MLPPRPPSPQVNAQPEPLPPLPPEPALPLLPATLSLPPPLTAGAMPELPPLLAAPPELELPPKTAGPVLNRLGSAVPQPTRIGSSQATPVARTQARLKVRRARGWGIGFTKVGNPVDLELVPDLLSLD